jgi:DNA adenine methylase
MPALQPPHAAPFLKWAGGKQRLLSQYATYFPPISEIGRYFEPFIGSAAVFFCLQPPQAILSDRNEKLVAVYRMVQQDVEGVIRALQPYRNEAEYYYAVRAQEPADLSPVEQAARLIYLNKTCYNGLYRENSKGEFNVPFGRYKNPTICDAPRLRSAAQALQKAVLRVADFATVAEAAEAGDFVYFDPPYAPLSPTSSFTGYDRHGFGEADQRRLAAIIHCLTKRGCRVMLSNSSAPLIYELYDNQAYCLIPIQARRNINSKGDRRGPVKELLILNYDVGRNHVISRPL